MLTLTDHAQDAVRALTPQAPESAGLRIAPANQGFELSLVTEPVPGDAIIDDGGVRVFVEPQTAQLLDAQTLDAQLVVRGLTQHPQAPLVAWLRIAQGDQGLDFSLVTEPVPGDALIDDGGVRVFVEPQTAQLLDEQTLDAQLDEGGEVNFFLASPDPSGADV